MGKQNDGHNKHTQKSPDESPWAQVKRTIKPLKNNKIHKVVQRNNPHTVTAPPPQASTKQGVSVTEFKKLLQYRPIPLCDTLDVGIYAHDLRVGDTSRINRSHARRLKSGNIAIDSVLDLHGCTQHQAYHKMQIFLTEALCRKHRMVKIITGKGKGILKNAVPKWINNGSFKPHVLTIFFARPEHGGTGAYYILFKNSK